MSMAAWMVVDFLPQTNITEALVHVSIPSSNVQVTAGDLITSICMEHKHSMLSVSSPDIDSIVMYMHGLSTAGR
jgi:hypothetical protein